MEVLTDSEHAYAIEIPGEAQAVITVSNTGRTGEYGKTVYHWSILLYPNVTAQGEDLQSHADPKGAMEAFIDFLEACGESYSHKMRHSDSEPENLDLFPPAIAKWAYVNSDELSMARLELEENDT